MSRHPRCTYNGPHAAHNFVTYTEPIDITHFGPRPIFEPIDRPLLEQLWCNGEPEPPAVCDCPDSDPLRRLTHQPWCPVWGL